MSQQKWDYLEREPAADAPDADNPSGMYCPACRRAGMEMAGHAVPAQPAPQTIKNEIAEFQSGKAQSGE